MLAKPENLVFEYFEDAATATNLAKDYSGANAELLTLGPNSDEIWEVSRLIASLVSTTALIPAGWGKGAALTNGLTFKIKKTGGVLVKDLTGGVPVKTNGDWGGICYDVSGFGGANPATDTYLHARWTFAKAGSPLFSPLFLQGHLGHYIEVSVDDDLSDSADITNFTLMIQGIKKSDPYS
jgi:hypothetical protein